MAVHTEYLAVAVFAAVCLAVALGMLTVTTLAGPKRVRGGEGDVPFESGADGAGAKNFRLSVKFYLTAILFVLFDIEAVFFYPWTQLLGELAWKGFAAMAVFVSILGMSLIYGWKKGALEWDR